MPWHMSIIYYKICSSDSKMVAFDGPKGNRTGEPKTHGGV
jgi:hypothetical protein